MANKLWDDPGRKVQLHLRGEEGPVLMPLVQAVEFLRIFGSKAKILNMVGETIVSAEEADSVSALMSGDHYSLLA